MEISGTLRKGSKGEDVKELQRSLKALGFDTGGVDGVFGEETEAAVLAFQNSYDLYDDGTVGQHFVDTLNGALSSDRPELCKRLIARGHRGDDVRILQTILGALGFDAGRPDGVFGGGTHDAVVGFQTALGLKADGVVGARTVDALFRALAVSTKDDSSADV